MTTPTHPLLLAARLLAAAALLSACSTPLAAPTIVYNPETVAAPPTNAPTIVPSRSTNTAPAPTPATPEPTTTEAAAGPTEPAAAALDLAAIGWDDRSLFAEALRPAEAAVLDTLPGASVYHLSITLADDLTSLSGHAAVRYTNQEAAALEAVAFHLHPNVLAGAITISNVTVDGSAAEPVYADQQASLEVPLAAPLEPGKAVVIEMDFADELPTELERNYGVYAAMGGNLALAHFYPMVAVYDATGWNVTPPVAQGDVTYSDVGFYLLQVTAPADLVVVGGGALIEAQAGPAGTQTLTFASGPARDIYVAASANYERTTLEADGVTLNAYVPPGLTDSGETALRVAAAAIADYEARYGPYPYRELDLAAIATGALGIEYPGIIALNQDLFDPQADFGGTPVSVLLEATTAHEVGHQWFYGLVGDDQLDEPWLDESLTQYATWRYFLDEQGPDGGEGFRQSLYGRWKRVDEAAIPIGLPVSAYAGAEYGAIVYGRGPLFVDALGERIGSEVLTDFLRDYATTYRWGIATTADFKALAETHCTCDLTDLFTEWVYPAE